MTPLVVDASVVVKWFVPEEHSEAARSLLQLSDHAFFAPDHLFAELGNTVWKKVRRGELDAALAPALVADMARVAIDPVSTQVLMADAYAIAARVGLTFYDGLYVALAKRLGAPLVTADRKMVDVLRRRAEPAVDVRWIGRASF